MIKEYINKRDNKKYYMIKVYLGKDENGKIKQKRYYVKIKLKLK